ncbi:HupE/UreJ family protein [Solimonas sp. K1W22B-7]|uniref:HupE/UreJ family protein n=1 Tax=Solimonas sp. K1W22B-7 TaxID=2303331 RepID=UPI0013C4E89C|nr:HupE/UreJ family protein [Solimonas sp. K1W22B-7]
MKRLLLLLALLWSGTLAAHPLAPALLQLKEGEGGKVELLWRASILQAVGVEPRLPADCRRLDEPAVIRDERGALTARWTLDCGTGLSGKTLLVPQLDRAGINVILRIERPDGSVLKTLLDASRPDYSVPALQAAPAVFPSYLQLGVEHLLLGFDHLLFVTGLVLLVRRLRALLITVTAFTLGHSITLSLAALGFVHVDSGYTELGIALSILLLACELARPAGSPPTLLARRPALMAVAFGLLHGLGFAGALAEIGLPQAEIPLALFGFNVGIELGQLLLVTALLGLGWLWRRLPLAAERPAALARLLPVYLIGSLAAYWCLERAAAL